LQENELRSEDSPSANAEPSLLDVNDRTIMRGGFASVSAAGATGARERRAETRFGLHHLRAQADFLRASGWTSEGLRKIYVPFAGPTAVRKKSFKMRSVFDGLRICDFPCAAGLP
jgi:hypothetical protein